MTFLRYLAWKTWLIVCWFQFRKRGPVVVLKNILERRYYPGFSLAFEEIPRILGGFILSDRNTCWHRSLLTLVCMLKKKEQGSILIGPGRIGEEWSLHIWIEDKHGKNISDISPEPAFSPLQKFEF